MGYWASMRSLIVDTPGRACAAAGLGCFVGGVRVWYRKRNSWEKPEMKYKEFHKAKIAETSAICDEFCRERDFYIEKENQLRARLAALEKELAALEKEKMERNSGVNGRAGIESRI